MKTYQDLEPNEKELFNIIEKIFINHASIEQKSFVRVLAILLNKYKFKKKADSNVQNT